MTFIFGKALLSLLFYTNNHYFFTTFSKFLSLLFPYFSVDGHLKSCVLALFQNTTTNKIDSEHTRDYTKLFPVCKVEILQVIVNKIEVLSSF